MELLVAEGILMLVLVQSLRAKAVRAKLAK